MVKKTKPQNKEQKKQIPEGVLIISGLLISLSIIFLLMSFVMFNYADQFTIYEQEFAQNYGNLSLEPAIFIQLGFFLIVLTIFFFLIARGLIKLQNRARITLIILIILTLLMSIYGLIINKQIYTSLFLIISSFILLWYLFRKDIVKKFN